MTTNNLPPGLSNHGNPDLICRQTRWSDYLVFFLGNYVAHAATLVSRPGDSMFAGILNIIMALLFPVTGVRRGFGALSTFAVRPGSSDLRQAARAGALCQVVLNREYMRTDYEVSLSWDCEIGCNASWWFTLFAAKVHGRIRLPPGYGLALVSPRATFDPLAKSETTLSSDYNAVKLLAAVTQVCFAVATLYRTRGDEINTYGWAAFGLTAIPYALMSIINLAGNLLCPRYPAIYVVENACMRQVQDDDSAAIFEGIVGRLIESEQPEEWRESLFQRRGRPLLSGYLSSRSRFHPKSRFHQVFLSPFLRIQSSTRIMLLSVLLCWLPSLITILIVGLLSRFQTGSSTTGQGSIIFLWFFLGTVRACLDDDYPKREDERSKLGFSLYTNLLWMIVTIVSCVPPIWGFVIVGQMLSAYGVCVIF